MRLVKRDLSSSDKDLGGLVKVVPEEAEDMWHAFNLISEGDFVTASTMRKVQQESSTGSSTSHRVHTKVTINVEAIDFDTTACHLRLKGKNSAENKYIKMGAYHTIDLELNRTFTLHKAEWDIVALDRLDLACDPAKSADVGAIVMQEGLANICLVTSCMTTVRARIDMNIPRKRRGNCSQHEKGLQRFYDAVLQAMLRHFDFAVIKCIVIASPGFVKDQFYEYMFAEAVKTDNKLLFEIKPKFVLVHSSSGHKYALREVLQDPSVASKLADTKAAGEVKSLDEFFRMLQNEPDRAVYGIKHVEYAANRQAVEVLMVTDELFRANDVATRKRYVQLIEYVKEFNAEVKIFSSLHVSGERLGQLTGVAAILRFPLPEIDDEEDESEEEEEEEEEDKEEAKEEEEEEEDEEEEEEECQDKDGGGDAASGGSGVARAGSASLPISLRSTPGHSGTSSPAP